MAVPSLIVKFYEYKLPIIFNEKLGIRSWQLEEKPCFANFIKQFCLNPDRFVFLTWISFESNLQDTIANYTIRRFG